MTNDNLTLIDNIIEDSIASGTITEKDKELVVRTLQSKQHIIADGICDIQRELSDMKQSLRDNECLIKQIKSLSLKG